MGELVDRTRINALVYGNGLAENYKNNCLYFYDLYLKSTPEVKLIQTKDVWYGRFYFVHYMDDSDWMKWSPIFVADFKKFGNKIILFAVNLNFLPLEVRVAFFDKFMVEQDFVKNDFLKVKMSTIYNELRTMRFEYSLMEFDASRIVRIHQIHLDVLPRFILSGHPQLIYDPRKLWEISLAKVSKSNERHKEMKSSLISDFYDVNHEIPEKYDVLKKHVQRIRNNSIKYSSSQKKSK